MTDHSVDTNNMVPRAEALRGLADRVEAGEHTFALEREIGAAVEPGYGDPPRRYLTSLDAAADFRMAAGARTSIREPAHVWTAAILRDLAHRLDAEARAHIKCDDCRHSKVMADGSRKDRGWGWPCSGCAPSTKPKFEPHPEHYGPWALVYRHGGLLVHDSWCERLGLPRPPLYPTLAAAERGAAKAVAGRGSAALEIDIVPYAEEMQRP